mgnify:FL=1
MLWTWKEKIEILYFHSDGMEEWLYENVLPDFHLMEIATMVILGAVGGCVVMGLDKLSKTK